MKQHISTIVGLAAATMIAAALPADGSVATDRPVGGDADITVVGGRASYLEPTTVGAPSEMIATTEVIERSSSGPGDAVVTQRVSAPAGVVVTPVVREIDVTEMAVGAPTSVAARYQVECVHGGAHVVSIESVVTAGIDDVADLVPEGDRFTVDVEVDCTVSTLVGWTGSAPTSASGVLELGRADVGVEPADEWFCRL